MAPRGVPVVRHPATEPAQETVWRATSAGARAARSRELFEFCGASSAARSRVQVLSVLVNKAIHAGPCNTRLRTRQVITAQEARRLITDGVRACVLCRPDTELGVIG
ncbi:DUF6233 domain-containing protein [Streptomyces achmelvichensis]|uniref:DUF6233 domain-containing protein n=1 Tax=Streptomyces achmelvichensis TaxID=3134111 RepID=UPI003C12B854